VKKCLSAAKINGLSAIVKHNFVIFRLRVSPVKRFDAENDIPVKKIDEKAKSVITYLVSGL
jgi:hypothetical protein